MADLEGIKPELLWLQTERRKCKSFLQQILYCEIQIENLAEKMNFRCIKNDKKDSLPYLFVIENDNCFFLQNLNLLLKKQQFSRDRESSEKTMQQINTTS